MQNGIDDAEEIQNNVEEWTSIISVNEIEKVFELFFDS